MKIRKTKFINEVDKFSPLERRYSIPDDFHLKEYFESKISKEGLIYLGEIFNNSEDTYYSARAGKKYRPKHDNVHLDEGHFQGYRFAIQELTRFGDWVFDPTVGSGTAIIEAINNGRNAVGIELEWPKICEDNVIFQDSESAKGYCIEGNAKDLISLLKNSPDLDPNLKFDLIINGTPYPSLGAVSSDAPERPGSKKEVPKNYSANGSFGLLKWGKGYEETITQMYKDCSEILKPGGYFVTIIKDPVRNKEPFLLQNYISEWVRQNTDLKDYGFFIHRHIPETMFMSTYNKKKGFENILIPKYQVGYIMRKPL